MKYVIDTVKELIGIIEIVIIFVINNVIRNGKMAYYDNKNNKIIYGKPTKIKNYKDWVWIDCGCCGGLQWGGYSPRECDKCEGNGSLAWHKKSGVLALYPGGKFKGKEEQK